MYTSNHLLSIVRFEGSYNFIANRVIRRAIQLYMSCISDVNYDS